MDILVSYNGGWLDWAGPLEVFEACAERLLQERWPGATVEFDSEAILDEWKALVEGVELEEAYIADKIMQRAFLEWLDEIGEEWPGEVCDE